MGRHARKISRDFPLHITGRCNNKEHFPVPLNEAWEIFSDYLFLIHHTYGIRIHKETSKEMNRIAGRINRIWGRPYHCSIITDPIYFFRAYKYNYRNPVAANLVHRVEDYPFSAIRS